MSVTHADPSRHRCLIYDGDASVRVAVSMFLFISAT
jgi:hypothetical protein